MFQLTLLDHLRLTFGHVVYRQKAHADIARSMARRTRWIRGAEALLMAATVFTAVASAFGKGQAFSIASAILAGAALITLIVHLAFDFDATARAHATCAARLWQVRERYRALLSDLSDGALEVDAGRRMRDALALELHAIYQDAPPADREAFEAAGRAAAHEGALTDEEIDVFLPRSLRKGAAVGQVG
jgi:conflict system pore-forming effector with SLATT domain